MVSISPFEIREFVIASDALCPAARVPNDMARSTAVSLTTQIPHFRFASAKFERVCNRDDR